MTNRIIEFLSQKQRHKVEIDYDFGNRVECYHFTTIVKLIDNQLYIPEQLGIRIIDIDQVELEFKEDGYLEIKRKDLQSEDRILIA